MTIDGAATVLTGVGLLVVAVVLLALLWDRTRWIARSALIVVSLVALVATTALQLNRLTETFPTWSALGGIAPAKPADDPGPEPTGDVPPPVTNSGSSVVEATVTGKASGMSVPMYVYLPAAYDHDRTAKFPVIEALHGYPGSPHTWINRMKIQAFLDQEMRDGRMAPTIVVMPYQTSSQFIDTECTDMTRGPKAETYLTVDVPAYAKEHFRVRADGRAWGLIGYSAGGFCATNLALKHPRQYAAGASLSGYGAPGITVGDGSERTTNNDDWRLANLAQPPVSLFLAWADDDHSSRREALKLAGLAKPPLMVTTAVVAHGGHSFAAWQEMEAPAFDWLSARLARPQR
jgi:S-formylglutathione hydrolase FrmB